MFQSSLNYKADKKSIGFVPTMGALHKGHLSLVRKAMDQNDIVVTSIFVNPIQFNDPGDYENYPNTMEKDLALLEELGCDIVFCPSRESFYQEQPKSGFGFGNLDHVMEGANRPGHFNGVAIVVSKLFHSVLPDRAYFGLKDLQQFLVIERLNKDLGFGVEIVGCPTVREESGLAFSSRNLRLSKEGLENGLILSSTLSLVVQKILAGKRVKEVLTDARVMVAQNNNVSLEYLEIGDMVDLSPVSKFKNGSRYAVCGAIWVEDVRLIDNLIFEFP